MLLQFLWRRLAHPSRPVLCLHSDVANNSFDEPINFLLNFVEAKALLLKIPKLFFLNAAHAYRSDGSFSLVSLCTWTLNQYSFHGLVFLLMCAVFISP